MPTRVPETVWLTVEPCPAATFDTLALLALLRVELASDGIVDVRPAPDVVDDIASSIAFLHVETPCTDGAPYVLRVDDLLTHKSVERQLLLEGLDAPTLLRALALALSELLHASWAELELVELPGEVPALAEALRVRISGLREARRLADPEVRGTDERDADPDGGEPASETREPTEDAARTEVSAAFLVRAFPSGSIAPFGGALRIDAPLDELWEFAIDIEGLYGQSLDPHGTIEIALLGGGVGVGARIALHAITVRVGARLGADFGWASGRPVDGTVVASSALGFVLLIGVRAELAVRLDPTWSLRFGMEGGVAPVGFVAQVGGIPVAGATGGALSAWGGVSIAP